MKRGEMLSDMTKLLSIPGKKQITPFENEMKRPL